MDRHCQSPCSLNDELLHLLIRPWVTSLLVCLWKRGGGKGVCHVEGALEQTESNSRRSFEQSLVDCVDHFIRFPGPRKQGTTHWVTYNNRNVLSYSSGGQKSEVKVSAGQGDAPSETCREILACLSPASDAWPPIFGTSWLSPALLTSLLSSSPDILPVCLWLPVAIFLSGHQACWIKAYLLQ